MPPYGQANFTNENFPLSVQTQVTGLNNMGTTVGFWSNTNKGVGLDSNFGFTDVAGTFTNVNNPNTATTPPVFNQYPYQARAGSATAARGRRIRLAPPGMVPVLS